MRWLSTLSISIVLVIAAVGGYYVYYVEGRMSTQHEEKLRSLSSIANLFEKRLGGLTSEIRNSPYLNYRDLPVGQSGSCIKWDFEACDVDQGDVPRADSIQICTSG